MRRSDREPRWGFWSRSPGIGPIPSLRDAQGVKDDETPDHQDAQRQPHNLQEFEI